MAGRSEQRTLEPRSRILSGYHIAIIGLVLFSVAFGLVLPFAPEMVQLMLVALIPAIIGFILILRNPYLGVYFFMFYSVLRPYDFLPFLRPLRLTMVIEIVTLVSWILALALSRTKIKWSWFHTAFLVFLGIIAVTVVTAANNYYAYQTFQAMAVYFVMFLILSNVVDSFDRIKKLVWLLLIIHLYFAAKGILTFVTGQHYIATTGQYTSGVVASGFIGDENDFAMTINMMIPFAFFGLFYLKGRAKFFAAVLLAVFVLAVISSFSRGGWVGLAAVITYGMFKVRKKFAVLGVILLLGATVLVFAPAQYWSEVSTVTDTSESTASTRLRYWDAGLRMFMDQPIIGVGASNGGIHMPSYVQGFRDANTQWGRAFHGTWIQVLAELGVLGSVVYLLMIVLYFRALKRTSQLKLTGDDGKTSEYLAKAITGSLIGYFACATFLSTAYYPQLWTMYMMAIAVIFVGNRLSKQQSQVQQVAPGHRA